MPMTREQLFAEAMILDATEREALAEELLSSFTDLERRDIDSAWLAEARIREEAFERGEMSSSSVEEVVSRIRLKAGR